MLVNGALTGSYSVGDLVRSPDRHAGGGAQAAGELHRPVARAQRREKAGGSRARAHHWKGG
ncbi:hypothetical protein HBB16_16995 [Pseudonocardia sp. MCCB 268]|nr:hypothetical protein [Pseudonocardia cytotoxica]